MINASALQFRSHAPDVRGRILEMVNYQNEHQLIAEFTAIAHLIGFDRHHYVAHFSTAAGNLVQRTISNLRATGKYTPPRTLENLNQIIQTTRLSNTPIIFKPPRPVSPQDAICNETTDNDDIGDGIVLPIHTVRGNAGVLGYFILAKRGDSRAAILSSLAEASLAAMYFHDALSSIILKSDERPKIELTQNERECLFWIARHKSNWDISRILGVSEHTIVYYVRRLMRKLDALNRHEAVERARAFALI